MISNAALRGGVFAWGWLMVRSEVRAELEVSVSRVNSNPEERHHGQT